ncbi:hypothetical protein D3C76_1672820 [compost metagenome]
MPYRLLELAVKLIPALGRQRDFGEAALGAQATERRGKEKAGGRRHICSSLFAILALRLLLPGTV